MKSRASADLLDTTVDVAEFGFSVDYSFTVNLDTKRPKSVRHWVLRPHCNPHLCHDITSLNPALIRWFTHEPLGVIVHFIVIMISKFVLLLKRMESLWAVVRDSIRGACSRGLRNEYQRGPMFLFHSNRLRPKWIGRSGQLGRRLEACDEGLQTPRGMSMPLSSAATSTVLVNGFWQLQVVA